MSKWPYGCHDTASCEEHRMCMYHQCVHTGKGAALGDEIDAAIVARTRESAAPDNFAVVRNALRFVQVEPEHDNALDALAAIEAELAALRENALDLSGVPTGWIIDYLDHDPGLNKDQPWCLWLIEDLPFPKRVFGDGPTPSAALATAVAKIGGGG